MTVPEKFTIPVLNPETSAILASQAEQLSNWAMEQGYVPQWPVTKKGLYVYADRFPGYSLQIEGSDPGSMYWVGAKQVSASSDLHGLITMHAAYTLKDGEYRITLGNGTDLTGDSYTPANTVQLHIIHVIPGVERTVANILTSPTLTEVTMQTHTLFGDSTPLILYRQSGWGESLQISEIPEPWPKLALPKEAVLGLSGVSGFRALHALTQELIAPHFTTFTDVQETLLTSIL